jgi:hypothetical protein
MHDSRFDARKHKDIHSRPKRPNCSWGPPCLLFRRYCGQFFRRESSGGKVTTHLHMVPSSRMGGAIPLLPIRLQVLGRENFLCKACHEGCEKFLFRFRIDDNSTAQLGIAVCRGAPKGVGEPKPRKPKSKKIDFVNITK